MNGIAVLPSIYIDRYLVMLTPEEYVCLTYLARQIFENNPNPIGRVSLAQFSNGKISEDDGKFIDFGTGLSEGGVRRAIASLVKYRLIERVEENDPYLNKGTMWRLLDEGMADLDGLIARYQQKKIANNNRVSAANRSKKEKGL